MSIDRLNEYATAEHALKYLAGADRIPHRTEGEAVLLEFVPREARRILDLGTGDGRLLALVRLDRPGAEAVALDFSATTLCNLLPGFLWKRVDGGLPAAIGHKPEHSKHRELRPREGTRPDASRRWVVAGHSRNLDPVNDR